MKEFFGLWAFGTIAAVVVIYLMMIILVSGVAFVTWDISIFKEAAAQADWSSFRKSVACGIPVAFVFACVADEI